MGDVSDCRDVGKDAECVEGAPEEEKEGERGRGYYAEFAAI